MSSSLVQYPSVHPFHSQIVKNTPDTVPPTEDLGVLQAELSELRQQTLERAKKADDDLRTIEECFRRAKEREKGKAKAVERTKRECAYHPRLVVCGDLTNSPSPPCADSVRPTSALSYLFLPFLALLTLPSHIRPTPAATTNVSPLYSNIHLGQRDLGLTVLQLSHLCLAMANYFPPPLRVIYASISHPSSRRI